MAPINSNVPRIHPIFYVSQPKPCKGQLLQQLTPRPPILNREENNKEPCIRSFADPVPAFEDPGNGGPVSVPKTLTNITNGKLSLKKNG
ncbi:hypothetical protein GQ457_04G035610 [Hibiscus cannabinus]